MAKALPETVERPPAHRDAAVIKVDPYDPLTGLLVPFVAQRMVETTKTQMPEGDPRSVARGVLSSLYQGDPRLLVLAIMDDDSRVVGHAVAQLGMDASGCWCTVTQLRSDANVGHGQKMALEAIRTWAQGLGATKLVLVTGRGDKSWEHEFGFKLARQLKVADITLGGGNGGPPRQS